jgi:membrane fusion protein, multidrug efflux system
MKQTAIGILFSMLILTAGCSKQNTAAVNESDQAKIFPVEVSTVKQIEWIDEIDGYGTIKTPDKVDIFPRISGKLVKLLVKEDQQVQNDEVVAIVERDEIGMTFKPVEVKSTVVGKIETIFLKEGAKVNDMTPIMSISKQAELKLIISLFETDLAKIKLGQESIITMDALPNQEFTGKVTLIKPILDASNNKGILEITLDGTHDRIMFGMFGRAKIIINRHPALSITTEALKRISSKDAVYLVNNNIIRLVFIEVGAQKENIIEILNGLNAGNTVITFASDEIKEGSHVKILGEQK